MNNNSIANETWTKTQKLTYFLYFKIEVIKKNHNSPIDEFYQDVKLEIFNLY